MADSEEKTSRTLFVRNLPFSTTNEKLEEVFGEAGPTKECFVVREPGVKDKCRGFGYVTFALREDAVKAKDQEVTLQGRKLVVSFADKKPKKRKKSAEPEQEGENKQEDSAESSPEKKTRTEHSAAGRVVVLRNFPAKVKKEKIQKLVSKYEGVEEVTYPTPDREEPTALVTFSSNKLARKALPSLGTMKVKTSTVKVILLSKDNKAPSKKSLKKSRLIVRNLSFKCNKEDLRKSFEKFGEITDVQIPTQQGGKKKGFAFVQFTNVFEAAKAVAEMNMKPLHGRPIAVDYAVPKNRYESAKTTEENEVTGDTQDQTDGDTGEDEEDSGAEDKSEDGTEEEDGEDGSDEDRSDGEEEEDDDDEEDDDSDDFSDDDDDDEKVDRESKTTKPFRESTDVQQGKTVFIRNLSYDSLDEDVEELFLQFGDIKYCKLVVDPRTEHSRGTGFVQFSTKEAAEKCVQQASTEGLSLAGRTLNVSIAVSRQQAQKLTEEKKEKEKKPTDKRNLYLAREGLIRPGTQAALGLTDKDVAMRQKVEKIKREKLKNPAIFVSDTRLCVRNIPITMGDRDLRRLFLKALGDKTVNITESRVMRDLKNVNSQGVGKSRGYGFLTFDRHEHALKALRETNNNPNLLSNGRRLIVEFSLENKLALKKKEMRVTKAKNARQVAKKNNKKQGSEQNGTNKPTNPTQPTEPSSQQPLSRKQKRKLRQQKRREKLQQEKLEELDNVKVSNQQSGVKAVKGTKGLPSHFGPKIRQRDRGRDVQKVVKRPKPKTTLQQTKQEPQRKMKTGKQQTPAKPSRRANRPERKEEAKFDQLVHRYKEKLFGKDSGGQLKKSKWFNG